MMCAEMEPFHVTDLPHSLRTLMPNQGGGGGVYMKYMTYAGSPSVAHIKMTLRG